MSAAFLLDGGQLFVTQAAVQSIVVARCCPTRAQALVRWTDALIGGAVALVAATVGARRPRCVGRASRPPGDRKISALLRAAGEVMVDGEVEPALDLLADARSTDHLIRELQSRGRRGDDGGGVVAVPGPAPGRHAPDGATWSIRSTGRCAAPACWSGRPPWRPTTGGPCRSPTRCSPSTWPTPPTWWPTELAADDMAVEARPALLAVGGATGLVERTDELTAEVILAQIRSVVVDLLLLTGLDQIESTDALPPPPR